MSSITDEDWDMATRFFEKDPDAKTALITPYLEIALHIVSMTSHSGFIERQVNVMIPESLAIAAGPKSSTALHYAATGERRMMIKALVGKNFTLTQLPNEDGQTTLCMISYTFCKNGEVLRFLANATTDDQPGQPFTGPHVAVLICNLAYLVFPGMASLCALVWILSLSAISIGHFRVAEAWAKPIGVCYGRVADNLPSAAQVIGMYKQYNIGKLRLYNPQADALNALRGTGIEVIVGVPDEDLPNLATGIGPTVQWVNTNLKPYYPDVAIKYVSAGNEVVPGELSRYVAPAIGNLQRVLRSYNMNILVTTAVAANVLGASYPPSAGAFSNDARADMVSILQYLNHVQAPLIVHLYPYFAYAADPADIRLDYAQFTARGPVVFDGRFQYQNLLDAMADAFYSALEREGFGSTRVIVGESGWPTAGNGNFTSVQLAQTYNRNFVKKILARGGTPKRPNTPLEGYVFAMFNEDNKAPGVERHWGLFYPNKSPVYPIF